MMCRRVRPESFGFIALLLACDCRCKNAAGWVIEGERKRRVWPALCMSVCQELFVRWLLGICARWCGREWERERERERLGKGLMPVMPLLFTAGYINWSRIQCAVQVIQLQSGSGWSVSTLIATQYSDTLPSYILSVGDHAVYPLDRQSQQHRWSGSIRRFCVCVCVLTAVAGW